MAFIIVYITNPDERTAKKIVAHLVKNKLAACGNIFPIKSMFWWKGAIKSENEVAAIVKTRKENWEKIKKEVKNLHPYEVPAIICINAEADKGFENWIMDETARSLTNEFKKRQ